MEADSNLSTSSLELHPVPELTFRRAFTRHWQESIQHYGLWRTVQQMSEALYRFVREFLPDRRKAKYGDLDYDFDQMIDTTRSNVQFRPQLIAAITGHQYFPSEPWIFEQMMEALPIHFQDFTFIDVGSGKGRVLVMAVPYGFKRILGVEFMPEWHRVAEQNISKLAAMHRPAMPIQSLCMDARDLQFPAGPLVVYMFNPFPEPVLATVLERLRQSLQADPRELFVAYRYPELEGLLAECDWLGKIAGTEQWAVYRNHST
ncbi:MAG TPA: class I SAM-dependent methyltransferase [Candidatus Angelobacter sp.]|jgi:SAM-dependent methyltransferase